MKGFCEFVGSASSTKMPLQIASSCCSACSRCCHSHWFPRCLFCGSIAKLELTLSHLQCHFWSDMWTHCHCEILIVIKLNNQEWCHSSEIFLPEHRTTSHFNFPNCYIFAKPDSQAFQFHKMPVAPQIHQFQLLCFFCPQLEQL